MVGILALTGFGAVARGLLVSALVDSEDQAMSFTPLVLIPQLLFAGAIVPVAKMAEPVHSLSKVMFAQWSFADLGTALHMNARIVGDPAFARADRFGTDFFNVAQPGGVLIL